MNLVESLLKADAKLADEFETGIFKSKRLGKIIGEKVADVEIKEIPSRRITDIGSYAIDSKGEFDASRAFDMKLMVCVEGVTNPSLKDKDLQAHFGCKSAKELAEKLFGSEVTELSDKISMLSGIVSAEEESDREAEIKN